MRLSLGPRLMQHIAAWSEDDPDYGALMGQIEGLELRIYRPRGNERSLVDTMTTSLAQMADSGWSQLLSVNEADEQVAILLKLDQERVLGVVVIALGAEEAVFINLIGNIQPENIQAIVSEIYGELPGSVVL